jgi:hypothetical protein
MSRHPPACPQASETADAEQLATAREQLEAAQRALAWAQADREVAAAAAAAAEAKVLARGPRGCGVAASRACLAALPTRVPCGVTPCAVSFVPLPVQAGLTNKRQCTWFHPGFTLHPG